MAIITELKRRNVVRVGVFYGVSAWLLLQVGDVLAGLFGLPDWTLRFVGFLLLLGFPLILILSWVYELTPEGVKREKDIDRSAPRVTAVTGRKLDIASIVVGLVAIGLVVWQQFGGQKPEPVSGEIADSANGRTAIAVLPFANLSGDDASLPFTQGLHDDLLTRLSRIGGLDVVSRTSVLEYAQTTRNIRTIAGELGVSHIMEGGVQRAGNRVRINVQLIDARDDKHLWADTYDRELTVQNIFDLQSAIANKIADELRITLTTPASELMTRSTDNLEAYEAYLRGKVEMESSDYTAEGTGRAIVHYRRAVELDPQFAAGWAELAEARDQWYWFVGRTSENREAIREAADRALTLDPDLPEGHYAMALYHYHGFLDYPAAQASLQRARESMGGEARFVVIEAAILRRSGNNDRAIVLFEKALRINPRYPGSLIDLFFSYQMAGRYADAQLVIDRLARINAGPGKELFQRGILAWEQSAEPELLVRYANSYPALEDNFYSVGVHELLGAVWASSAANGVEAVLDWQATQGVLTPTNDLLSRVHYLHADDPSAFRQPLELVLETLTTNMAAEGTATPTVPLRVAHVLVYLGRIDEAMAMLEASLQEFWIAKDASYAPSILRDVAIIFAIAGEPDRALHFVAQSMDVFPHGGMCLRAMMADPALEPLVDHPDFQAILDRHGWVYKDRSLGLDLPGGQSQ